MIHQFHSLVFLLEKLVPLHKNMYGSISVIVKNYTESTNYEDHGDKGCGRGTLVRLDGEGKGRSCGWRAGWGHEGVWEQRTWEMASAMLYRWRDIDLKRSRLLLHLHMKNQPKEDHCIFTEASKQKASVSESGTWSSLRRGHVWLIFQINFACFDECRNIWILYINKPVLDFS